MNRLNKIKGYGSNWKALNSQSVLNTTQTKKIALWMMMNRHEPIKLATWSATRAPIELFSSCTICHGFSGRMMFRSFHRIAVSGDCRSHLADESGDHAR